MAGPVKMTGRWIDRKHYVWEFERDGAPMPILDDNAWAVSCGCDIHGDHMGCTKECARWGCIHPAGVSVTAAHVTPAGALEYGASQGEVLNGPRPPKKRRGSKKDLAEWFHHRWAFEYGECDHGTYTGGPSHGEPYAMCERWAESLSEYLRRDHG